MLAFPSLQTTFVAGTYFFQSPPFSIAFHSAFVPANVILVKLAQFMNAISPMFVTLPPITVANAKQAANNPKNFFCIFFSLIKCVIKYSLPLIFRVINFLCEKIAENLSTKGIEGDCVKNPKKGEQKIAFFRKNPKF